MYNEQQDRIAYVLRDPAVCDSSFAVLFVTFEDGETLFYPNKSDEKLAKPSFLPSMSLVNNKQK